MASFDEIKAVRLRINDPSGIIDILSVADDSSLPSSPAQQTAYYVESTGRYKSTELEEGATPEDYETEKLYLSDALIGSLIDSLGLEVAICRALKEILGKLGREIRSISAGAESTTYQSMSELYNYYKKLSDDCMADKKTDALNSTGRYVRTQSPIIAGGNI